MNPGVSRAQGEQRSVFGGANVTLDVVRSRAGTSPRGRTDVSDPLELFLLPGRVTHRVTSSRPLEITSERPFER